MDQVLFASTSRLCVNTSTVGAVCIRMEVRLRQPACKSQEGRAIFRAGQCRGQTLFRWQHRPGLGGQRTFAGQSANLFLDVFKWCSRQTFSSLPPLSSCRQRFSPAGEFGRRRSGAGGKRISQGPCRDDHTVVSHLMRECVLACRRRCGGPRLRAATASLLGRWWPAPAQI